MVFKLAIEKNKIKNLKVKKYFSWGTPSELNLWKRKFEKNKTMNKLSIVIPCYNEENIYPHLKK